jgi:arylsulfatase A-like enzyme
VSRWPPRLCVAALVSLAACTAQTDQADETGAPAAAEPVRRALFVGIDGMRPDALQAAQTPHLDRLRAAGAWSMAAQTQQTGDTVSAAGWTSIFTGVEVSTHGVQANGDYATYDRSFETFAGITRRALGRSTAAAAHWPEILSAIHGADDFDDALLTDDDGVADRLARHIEADPHALLVAHLDDVDHAGHASGFSADNADYLSAIEDQDARVGRLLAAIDARPSGEDWLVVVTSDHGGDAAGHGARNADCRTIPLLIWGGGAPAGELDPAGDPSHLDVFPTVLSHLGVDPQRWAHAAGQSRVAGSD